MKNRNTIVVLFLLVAAMLLGVGYATLSDTLDITGSADINVSDLEKAYEDDIYFVSASPEPSTLNTASLNPDNKDKASFSAVSLQKKGDKAVFTFVIANESAHDVVVTPKLNATLGNTNPAYFSITSSWNAQSRTIPAMADGSATPSTIEYVVTVELLEDPTEAVSGSFLIELVAVADNQVTGGGI